MSELSPRCAPKRTSARALYDLFKEVALPSACLAEVGIESEARLHKYGPVKGVPFLVKCSHNDSANPYFRFPSMVAHALATAELKSPNHLFQRNCLAYKTKLS